MCSLIGNNIGGLATCLTGIISGSLIPLIGALGAVLLVWGIVNYFIIGAGEEAKRTQGKQFIMWGIIAFLIIISVWALVNILGRTFGIGTGFFPRVTPNGSLPTTTSGGGSNTGGGVGGGSTGGSTNGGQCVYDEDCPPDASGISQSCQNGTCVI